MGKLILVILSSLLITSQVQAKTVDEYSQEELQEIIGRYSGCTITKNIDNGSLNFKLVSVPAESGDFVYFIEITEPNADKVVIHLRKTHFLIGGYRMQATEEKMGLGWDIEVILVFLNGYDFKINSAKNGWIGETLEGYTHCKSLN